MSGGNWWLCRRAGERLGQRLRVSQAGLTPGHGGLSAPRLPSEHPQPALQLGQGLSPCHPLCAGMPGSTRARAEATGLPCPCTAQEMLVVPREDTAQQRATTVPGMSPKLGQTPSPLSPLRYVPGEPPRGPSPPGRREQGQDRGHPVRPALQIRAEIPRRTPAAPPHSGPRGHHQHPNTPQDPQHSQEGDSPQAARGWPVQQPRHRETGRGRRCTGKLRGVAMEAAAPK